MEERNEVEIETPKKDPYNVVGVVENNNDVEEGSVREEVKEDGQATINEDSGDQGKIGKCV